jgi:tetratricopeptide (TPR) repeat protein
MERRYDAPTYTLRLHELQIDAGDSVSEVYFQIRIDGAPVAVDGVPNASSRAVDRLTIVRGVPMKFAELGIPLKEPTAQVHVDVMTSGYFRTQTVASIAIDLAKRSVGDTFRVTGANGSATVELLPPVAIGSISVAGAKGEPVTGVWLQVSESFAPFVTSVRWFIGDSVVQGNPDRFYYRGGIAAGNTVRAKVIFRSGSGLTLAIQARGEIRDPRTPEELYAVIDLVRASGDARRALALTGFALRDKQTQRWAFQVHGAVLRETGRFEEALVAYAEALKRDPDSPATVVGQALTLVDWSASSSRALVEARRSVEQAIKIDPAFSFAHVALGGVAARLQDFSRALEVLARARDLEQQQGYVRSTSLQRNHYYTGLAYVGLRRRSEATTHFAEVIAYAEKWGYRSLGSQQLVEFARTELGKL